MRYVYRINLIDIDVDTDSECANWKPVCFYYNFKPDTFDADHFIEWQCSIIDEFSSFDDYDEYVCWDRDCCDRKRYKLNLSIERRAERRALEFR